MKNFMKVMPLFLLAMLTNCGDDKGSNAANGTGTITLVVDFSGRSNPPSFECGYSTSTWTCNYYLDDELLDSTRFYRYGSAFYNEATEGVNVEALQSGRHLITYSDVSSGEHTCRLVFLVPCQPDIWLPDTMITRIDTMITSVSVASGQTTHLDTLVFADECKTFSSDHYDFVDDQVWSRDWGHMYCRGRGYEKYTEAVMGVSAYGPDIAVTVTCCR